jgi:hypothetical protein
VAVLDLSRILFWSIAIRGGEETKKNNYSYGRKNENNLAFCK